MYRGASEILETATMLGDNDIGYQAGVGREVCRGTSCIKLILFYLHIYIFLLCLTFIVWPS